MASNRVFFYKWLIHKTQHKILPVDLEFLNSVQHVYYLSSYAQQITKIITWKVFKFRSKTKSRQNFKFKCLKIKIETNFDILYWSIENYIF